MIHRTLESYHTNTPYREEQEHPDGPLWLIASSNDWDMIPTGVVLEHVFTGKLVTYEKPFYESLNTYGVRGYHE